MKFWMDGEEGLSLFFFRLGDIVKNSVKAGIESGGVLQDRTHAREVGGAGRSLPACLKRIGAFTGIGGRN